MQCRNNLKQIGLALHNYHARTDSFPPGWVALGEDGRPESDGGTGFGWAAHILPELDQGVLGGATDLQKSMLDHDEHAHDEDEEGFFNTHLIATVLPVFQCPSDDGNDTFEVEPGEHEHHDEPRRPGGRPRRRARRPGPLQLPRRVRLERAARLRGPAGGRAVAG